MASRPDRKFLHEWHVAINRFHDSRPHGEGSAWMYEAKDAADEIPRSAILFAAEREDRLPKVHQQCSFSAPEPIAKNELTCCLGVKCAECPQLKAIESAKLAPEQIDLAKAWTCAIHIVSKGGDQAREGYLLTTDDRMFWDRTYANLAADMPEEDTP